MAAVGGATQGVLDLCDMLCSMRQYAVHVLGSVSFPSHPDMYEDDAAWEGMGGWKDAVLAALASLPGGLQQTQQAGTGGRGLLFRAAPWQFVAGGPDGGMSEVGLETSLVTACVEDREVVVKLRRALASAFKRSADGYPLDIAYGPDRGWWLQRRFLNRAGEFFHADWIHDYATFADHDQAVDDAADAFANVEDLETALQYVELRCVNCVKPIVDKYPCMHPLHPHYYHIFHLRAPVIHALQYHYTPTTPLNTL